MNDSNKNSILIVDDEEFFNDLLSNVLDEEYTIYKAYDGAAALEMADMYMPDLILLDIIMPGMTGFDVLSTLKKTEKTQKIPVIIITGLNSVTDEEKGLTLGAADYVYKPISIRIIKTKVSLQMQIVNQVRALEQYAHIQSAIAAAEEKSKFFARMSHEMRTPLNAVIGLAELTLEADGLNEEARDNVENISDAGSSLLRLVNDILDFSKIESGMFNLTLAEYDPSSMISDVITQSIMWKGEKPIELILNIDENIPKSLIGDELRVKQIFNNLLSNAFKYTVKGTVELNVSCETLKDEDDAIMLVISVKDTGIGIQRENIDRLFTEYVQMETKRNVKMIGTGLGLSIAKMIVELMSGTIKVESEFGKGSVFTVMFPQKYTTKEVLGLEIASVLKNSHYQGKKRKSRISRINLSYAHVLVVDDVMTNLDVAKGMMKPYGMQIDCVTSGQQAVNAVRNEKVRYNAIFMDHMMPEMDGIEATRIIREEIGTEYAKNIPIIAFTANAIIGTKEMFLSKGFQDFLSKPVDFTSLDTVVKRWVRDEEMEKMQAHHQVIVNGELVFDNRTGIDRRSGRGDRRMKYDRRLLATETSVFST
ncbi:MAG: response regulator [Treponema sp.]|jgi:signal transduction histidine kinase|nr:response regulator [Treponema sp.]